MIPPYRDASLTVEERVTDLLGRMTLTEKVGQLNQRLYGWRAWRRTADGFAATDELLDEARQFGGIGAIYGLQRADAWSGQDWSTGVRGFEGAELCAEIQRTVVAESRLGIPALFVEEVPHGHQALDGTVLPVALAVASTWDPDRYEKACRAVAREVRVRGVHVALVSTLDVLRDPRWGRAEETFGEDPFLAAAFTTATVRGMQGEGLAVVLKHAAGQGATVGGRNWAATELGRRELAEIHLPPVRAAAEAGAAGLMAAYSEVEGRPAAANRELLTGVFREALGFQGLIMADGTALDRLLRLTGDPVAAAALALRSGVDLSLWDEVYPHLGPAVECGLASEADLNQAVARVLTLKFALGLFDPAAETSFPGEPPASAGAPAPEGARPGPAAGAAGTTEPRPCPAPVAEAPNCAAVSGRTDATESTEAVDSAVAGRPDPTAVRGNAALSVAEIEEEPASSGESAGGWGDLARESAGWARELAARSMILLHDRAGVLPIGAERVAVLGPHADTLVHALGDYTAPQPSSGAPTIVGALRERSAIGAVGAGTRVVTTAPGADIATGDLSGIPEAVALARAADVVVLCLGGSSARDGDTRFDVNGAALAGESRSQMTAGEGADLARLELGAGQRELLRRVAATGTPVVAVVVQGRPHVLGEVLDRAGACLTTFYPGPWLGEVVADVLLGRRRAEGRLPVSLPRDAASLPVHYNHRDHAWAGYTDAGPGPLVPFGAGPDDCVVTGTRLRPGDRISLAELRSDTELTCEVTVSNRSPARASTIVQLYVHRVTASIWPRTRELRGFRRVTLDPGTTVTVDLPVGWTQVSDVDDEGRPRLEAGRVEIQVGTSVTDLIAARLTIVP